jgi:hypothetical protein
LRHYIEAAAKGGAHEADAPPPWYPAAFKELTDDVEAFINDTSLQCVNFIDGEPGPRQGGAG